MMVRAITMLCMAMFIALWGCETRYITLPAAGGSGVEVGPVGGGGGNDTSTGGELTGGAGATGGGGGGTLIDLTTCPQDLATGVATNTLIRLDRTNC